MKAVFDANVYISALITKGGSAEQAYRTALVGAVELYTSIPILTETAKKLREKFEWGDEQVADAVRHISSVATVVKPRRKIVMLSDDPDNRILECAVSADAEIIVTGDKHLLGLTEFKGIRIQTIAEFLKEIKKHS